MNTLTQARLLLHILHWRFTWNKRDIDYRPRKPKNPKFISAREAAMKIPDGATVLSSGMAGNTRCSIFFWAIREQYERTSYPRDLTWITVGAQGGRGRVPGTMEEMALPGLVTRWIGGHVETVKAFLHLADQGQCEIHALPQGIETFLFEAQANGHDHILSEVGVGTFLDPRVGRGSPILPGVETNFVAPAGNKLRYHVPPIDVSVFVIPYADEEGNLYKDNACMVTECYEGSLAAKRNGGLVIASVSDIVSKDESKIFLPADKVDYIVLNPRSEQTGSVPQRRYWPMFTVEGNEDMHESVEKLKFANNVLKITPVRGLADDAVSRLAAHMFIKAAQKGALVNIGVGLPEEVCRLVYEGGLYEDITFFTETGVVGGIPAPGIFFGAAVNPKEIITSAQVFHRAEKSLDVTILGLLEADSDGNVNVSKRGEGAINYVGAGGFPDLTHYAKTVFFVGSWMAHSKMTIENGKLKVLKTGEHKFKEKVDEITFNGKKAVERGQNVYYITNIGVFHLTQRGMELVEVMPGVDIQQDILDACPMKVALPESGDVPVVPDDIVTGRNYRLSWENGED